MSVDVATMETGACCGSVASRESKLEEACGGAARGCTPACWKRESGHPPDKGTAQGGGASPLVANGFLPQGLAEWCGKAVQPRRQGRGFVPRFADAFSIGCEWEADARRVMAVLPKRVKRFSLPRHPAKTAWIACKRPPRREASAGGAGRFAFRGLTHYGATTRRGDGVRKRNTVGKRLRRFLPAMWAWGRDNRHAPWHEQERTLWAKLRGDYPYYGSRGNCTRLAGGVEPTERAWRYGLSSRRHKGHIRWQKCVAALQQELALPKARSLHNL